MTHRGLFITFEGLDGAGKSTQIERLQHRLSQLRQSVTYTREPGGTKLGDEIRALLLGTAHSRMVSKTEVLLYAASRAQLVAEVIEPALARGEVVLCDRFVDASLAYQGAGLGVGVPEVSSVNQFATGGLKPDVTILFHLPVETSQARVRSGRNGTNPDRIEQRTGEYFTRVQNQFMKLAALEPSRIVVVDACLSVDELEQEIWSVISNYLKNLRD
jgi:dTMP kinase